MIRNETNIEIFILPLIILYSLIIIFEVIIIIVTVKSQLFANSLSISRTKYIITYCFPLSITVDFNVSLIRITASLKLYQTRERITVPDPNSICCKNVSIEEIFIHLQQQTVASLELVLLHPLSMRVKKEIVRVPQLRSSIVIGRLSVPYN